MSVLPMVIDSKWLCVRRACEIDYNAFCTEWPEGAEVNITNLKRAAALGIDLVWFAEKILPRAVFSAYSLKTYPFLSTYRRKRELLYAEYDADSSVHRTQRRSELFAALEDYEVRHTLTFAEYNAKEEVIHAEYYSKLSTLYKEYELKLAPFKAKYQTKCNTLVIVHINEYYKSEGQML